MKKIVLITGILIFVLSAAFILSSNKSSKITSPETEVTQEESKETNFKASFAIYTNGIFRVFTAPMYHNLSTDVFIEAPNPNIINVKKSNITWRDFFNTLPFELNETCLTTGTKQTFCTNENFVLQFYLNGERNQKALDQVIKPKDKLLVTYGEEDSTAIQQQLEAIPNSE